MKDYTENQTDLIQSD